MATQVAAAANLAMSIMAMAATAKATRMQIGEGKKDYAAEIANLEEQKAMREAVIESEIARGKETGVAALTERGEQATFDTRMATMKAEQELSSAEARLGASGVRAGGTALAAAQQRVDIAYAGAERTAEAGIAGMKIGGMQLGSELAGGREQKSLLTMEYGQTIAEQKRKLKELKANEENMVLWAGLGAGAGVTSAFYTAAQTGLFGGGKK